MFNKKLQLKDNIRQAASVSPQNFLLREIYLNVRNKKRYKLRFYAHLNNSTEDAKFLMGR